MGQLQVLYTQILHGLGAQPHEREMCIARRREALDQGLARFPNSLLLRFNRAHWDFMLAVVDEQPPAAATLAAFRAIVDDFARLEFEPVGADLGIAYTLLHVDQVFPYYDYGQLMVRRLVHARTPALAPGASLADPRDAVLAAAHGFIGWGLVLAGAQPGTPAFDEALEHFARSLTLFPDNLPLLRLNFRTMARAWHVGGDGAFARRLIDAFFAYANKFPTALLTDIAEVLPAAEKAGETETLHRLLAEWYGFARCVEFVHNEDLETRRRQLKVIARYRSHFPEALKARLASLQADADAGPSASMTSCTPHQRLVAVRDGQSRAASCRSSRISSDATALREDRSTPWPASH